MNVTLLIGAVLRQTVVLVAQLATSGGLRAPLSHVADQVFVELSRELEAQGLNQKVSADMFGMALRSYQRKVQRLGESSTERGRSLWEAVYDFVRSNGITTRKDRARRAARRSCTGRTICTKLSRSATSSSSDEVGGSTYSYEIRKGHPLEGGPECILPNDNSEGFAAGGNSFVPYENPCTSITSCALNEPPDAGLPRCNLDAVLSEIGVDAGPPCAAGEVRANVCTTCLAGCGRRELKCVKSCDTQEDCTAANAPGTCMASVCQEFCPF